MTGPTPAVPLVRLTRLRGCTVFVELADSWTLDGLLDAWRRARPDCGARARPSGGGVVMAHGGQASLSEELLGRALVGCPVARYDVQWGVMCAATLDDPYRRAIPRFRGAPAPDGRPITGSQAGDWGEAEVADWWRPGPPTLTRLTCSLDDVPADAPSAATETVRP